MTATEKPEYSQSMVLSDVIEADCIVYLQIGLNASPGNS